MTRPTSMRPALCLLGCLLLSLASLPAAPGPASVVDDAWLTRQLAPAHPRLLWPAGDDAARLREIEADPVRAAFFAELRRSADALDSQPVLSYRKVGRRLLATSREALRRVVLLATVHRLTGDPRYAARAEEELLAVAAFNDWNPSHYLDTAEMTAAVAIGYDWLFDRLSPDTRARLREAIVEKGIEPSFQGKQSWVDGVSNWTQVCHGGLLLGALALADELPELAVRVVRRAVEHLPRPLAAYEPDGVYPEGPGYWGYGTAFHVVLVAALRSAVREDFGLADAPGFRNTLAYLDQVTAPSGRLYNYADNSEGRGAQAAVFWLAQLTTNGPALDRERTRLANETSAAAARRGAGRFDRFLPLALFWAAPLSASAPPLPTGWLGRSDNPIAVFRSRWDDSNAVFAALKGGRPSGPHGHEDSGSFLLEADGVRWAEELGQPDYTRVETAGVKLWGAQPGSQRWRVLEISAWTHNLITFNQSGLDVTGQSRFVRFTNGPAARLAVVDNTPVHRPHASRSWRGLRCLPDQRVLVQDELSGVAPGTSIRWAMLTRAEVTLGPQGARLSRDGKTLDVTFLEPRGLALDIIPLDTVQGEGNAPRPGWRLLTATRVSPGPAAQRWAVLFTPGSVTSPAPPPALAPLESWPGPVSD